MRCCLHPILRVAGITLDLGVKFSTFVIPGIDESYPANLPVMEVAAYISRVKADAYAKTISASQLIITADTVVVCDGAVLGKPEDKGRCRCHAKRLSGKVHYVVTGVTITTATRKETFSAVSEVEFAELEDDEIEYYVETYLPLDKAGA